MAPTAPRRVRRKRPEGAPISLWETASLLQHLDDIGIKRSHAGPLCRAAATHILGVAQDSCSWGPFDAGSGKENISNDCTALSEKIACTELSLPEHKLLELGLPRSSTTLLSTTTPFSTRLIEARTSGDGSTTKLLLELHDGHSVETVVMRHDQRTTVCVSSQVGCQMGCTFCATGTLPIVGDLSSGEIVEQLLHAHAVEVAAGRTAVRNAVFMGMGEPLNNYDNVLAALRTMTDMNHLGTWALTAGKVTVSTVGVVSRMRQLAKDVPAISLALSLHAPNQDLREEIVPAARHTPLPELMEALDEHLRNCRRPTPTAVGAMIEYVLLHEVNDSDACAVELGQLLAPRARDVMINLIPYNPGATSAPRAFTAPPHKTVERFQQIVAAHGVTTRVRREMGRDIAGACGQLALVRKNADGASTSNVADSDYQLPAADVEDFVAWRRRQSQSSKAAVNKEAVAMAQAARSGAKNGSGVAVLCGCSGGLLSSAHRLYLWMHQWPAASLAVALFTFGTSVLAWRTQVQLSLRSVAENQCS